VAVGLESPGGDFEEVVFRPINDFAEVYDLKKRALFKVFFYKSGNLVVMSLFLKKFEDGETIVDS
jgi:hypothetical protein